MKNLGLASGGSNSKGWGIRWILDEPYHNHTVNNIQIYNNVISASTTGPTTTIGIILPGIGTATNIYIRNNIIQNWDMAAIYASRDNSAETISGLYVQNNLCYNNAASNALVLNGGSGLVLTNYTNSGNILGSNPLFVSTTDYHIQATSPGINLGYDVDLTMDYDSVAVHATTPDIGAYEYVVPGGGDETAPTVTTTAITAISSTTATSGGNVTDDGGDAVTARGVCWGAGANPTTAGSKTTDGAGTGAFTSSITGLTKNNTYHVRAYATNSIGTSYGADVTFTTPNYLIVVW